jgi:uncharacterized protein YegJ (DUF2314 family)
MRVILTIFLAISVIGCSRSKENGNYSTVSADDPAMNAAIAKAKATVGDFVQAFHAQKPGTSKYCVKKPFPTPNGGVEHMWITVTDEHNGILKGIVDSDAEDTHEVKLGQEVTLNISEISDWSYADGKKLIGGYTIRYFLDKMSEKERQDFLEKSGMEL